MSSPCRSTSLAIACALALAACQREDRDYRGPPPPAAPAGVSPTSLMAGGAAPRPTDPRAQIYEGNAFHVGEGKRWYDWYNCYGCHSAGGGGDIGPPLIDDQWIYGGSIEQIHASIVEGRPNGMPSFAGRIPDAQAWQLAAYVRAMAGNVRGDVPPSRGDEARTGVPLTQAKPAPPKAGAPVDQPR